MSIWLIGRLCLQSAIVVAILADLSAGSCVGCPPPDSVISGKRIGDYTLFKIVSNNTNIEFINDTIFDEPSNSPPTIRFAGLITFRNCIFEQDFLINNARFFSADRLINVSFDSCQFYQDFELSSSSFESVTWISFNHCVFGSSMTIRDNRSIIGGFECILSVVESKIGKNLVVVNDSVEGSFAIGGSNIHGAFALRNSTWKSSIASCIFEKGSSVFGQLESSKLYDCQFVETVFEPTNLPVDQSMGSCGGIQNLRFQTVPSGLTALRSWYRSHGYRTLERNTTFAIRRSEYHALSSFEKVFQWVLFDLTCSWGKDSAKAFYAVILLVFALCPLYWLVAARGKRNDILREWTHTRQNGEKVIRSISIWRLSTFSGKKSFVVWRLVLLYSLMSATNIGFRDFNFGRWIRNILKNEYDLRGVGWIRTISGLQALISVYLLALFLLSYFGRPFE